MYTYTYEHFVRVGIRGKALNFPGEAVSQGSAPDSRLEPHNPHSGQAGNGVGISGATPAGEPIMDFLRSRDEGRAESRFRVCTAHLRACIGHAVITGETIKT